MNGAALYLSGLLMGIIIGVIFGLLLSIRLLSNMSRRLGIMIERLKKINEILQKYKDGT